MLRILIGVVSICPTLPWILKRMSVIVCIFAYAPRLHHLLLSHRRRGAWNSAHPPLSFQAGKVGRDFIYHQRALKLCAGVSWAGFQGRCCLLLPVPFTSFPFQLAEAGGFLKKSLSRTAQWPFYPFVLREPTVTATESHPRKCWARGSSTLSKRNRPLAQPFALTSNLGCMYGLNASGCGPGKCHCSHSVVTVLALTVAQPPEERAMQHLPQTRELWHPAPCLLQGVIKNK